MTIYRGPQVYKPDNVGALSESERLLMAQHHQAMWKAFYANAGLTHVKTEFTTGVDGQTIETVVDDCGIDALDGINVQYTTNTIWNIASNWLLDDGLKPIYLRFMLGQYYVAQGSTNTSYHNKFCGYWYIGEELDVNSNVAYGQNSTVYNVWSDSGGMGGSNIGAAAQAGQYFLSSYSDGTIHVAQSVIDQAPNAYAARHFFMERSRDEAGNIDEKGVVAGLMGPQYVGYGSAQQSAGYTFTVSYEFDGPAKVWYNDATRKFTALQHFPLTNDGYSGTYDNNIVPMSTMVARWGNKWWPSRAFVIVPDNYVAPMQDVFISINGSPRKYNALMLGSTGTSTSTSYFNLGSGEQTLVLWE